MGLLDLRAKRNTAMHPGRNESCVFKFLILGASRVGYAPCVNSRGQSRRRMVAIRIVTGVKHHSTYGIR